MAETKICPKCGVAAPENAPSGICPKCLMQAVIQGDLDEPPSRAINSTLSSGFVPPAPEELAKHLPQFEVLELLGMGGMGAVYKARQPALDRLVAVKILPPEVDGGPEFAERFAREARALAKLSHQNIVAIYDFGHTSQSAASTEGVAIQQGGDEGGDKGLYYFVMEYVDGANLRQLIGSGGVAPHQALAIVPQICEALQFAHEEGIVHRDIKPENILLDNRGRVKIADFGLAKLLRADPVGVTLTRAQQVMGTWHYMAPEQIERPREVDHRADIYSLGVVFYELLTGELPLGRFEPPSKKSHLDARLDEVVLRAMEREPDRRYQHASEVKTDVESLSGTGATASNSAADYQTDANDPSRLLEHRRSHEEREALFGDLVGVSAMLALLALVAFGMWVTGSPWFLVALCLPWIVPGIAAAIDKRDETSALVHWALGIAVLGTFSLLGYGIWLAKSGWPLLAIVMPFVGLGAAYGIFSQEEEAANDSAEADEQDAEAGSEAWGCGSIILMVIVWHIAIVPALAFVSGAISDVSHVLVDALQLDARLQRPLWGLLWVALVAGLAYAGYQIWTIVSEPRLEEEEEDDARERLQSRLKRAGIPLFVLLMLILASLPKYESQPRARAGGTAAESQGGAISRPLLEAAENGDAARIRQLLQAGAAVNAVDPETGETALMKAAGSGHVEAAVVLMLRRANEQARDKQGRTPLMHAVEQGQLEVVKLLLAMEAIRWDEEVQFRVTRLDPERPPGEDFQSMRFDVAEEAQDAEGETALMKAAARGDQRMTERLLLARDTRDKRGRTALMHACLNRQTAFLRAAIDDAERSLRNHRDGHGYVGFVHPEGLTARDDDGKTALQHAREQELDDVAAQLERYLQNVIQLETASIEKGHHYVWYSYQIRGLCHRALGNEAQAESDLAKSRERRKN